SVQEAPDGYFLLT
nr:immunoglobulin heavy chain junction region [Mus musculus]